MLIRWYYLRHSSPGPSFKCRFGRSSAGFDLFGQFGLFLSAGLDASMPVLKRKVMVGFLYGAGAETLIFVTGTSGK